MSLSTKYELESIAYSTPGWNGIANTNFLKLDDHLHTRGVGTCGETVLTNEAVYWGSDGKIYLAQADGTKQPCIGLMTEGGLLDEGRVFQIRGPVYDVGWTWTVGGAIYLDPTTPGDLTQTPSGSNAQILGYAQSATTIFLTPLYMTSLVGDQPYEIGGTYNGTLANSLCLTRLPCSSVREFYFPSGLASSSFYAKDSATVDAILSLKKDGVEFGTVTFLAGQLIDNAAAVDKTGGKVGIPVTGHGLAIGTKIKIAGSINYNDDYILDGTTTTNEIVITETYAAETFTGVETLKMHWAVITSAVQADFVDGNIFEIIAPTTADVTLANLGWIISGVRTS